MFITYESDKCEIILSVESNQDFSQWLVDELNKRGWSQADLKRATGLSSGGVSNLINQVREPSLGTCKKIAKAFGIHPDIVYRKSGLYPEDSEPEDDPLVQTIAYLSSQLDEQDQEEVIAFIQTKKRLGEQRGKYRVQRQSRSAGP